MHFKIITVILFLAVACSNPEEKNSKEKIQGDTTVVNTAITIEPNLKNTDSLELLYFLDPDGDSLRYTRYYTYLATRDTGIINEFSRNMENQTEQFNAVKPCRSEGKIYAYNKGESIKTIYFSTRCDTCCYMYFIKNGKFIYMNISGQLKNKLAENKHLSKEPVAPPVD